MVMAIVMKMISGLVFELLAWTVEALVPESSGCSQVLFKPDLFFPDHIVSQIRSN